MAILTRVPFGDIELLSVNAAPYGISALTGSLAVLNSNGTVYRNNGTSWTTVNKESKIIQSTYNQNTALGGEFGAPGFTSVTCPFDDTIPQLSEGSVCLTSTPITTKSSTSTIRITFNGVFAVNIVGRGIIHVHRNNAANAEYVTTLTAGGSAMPTSANPHTASSVFFNYETSSPGAGQTLTYKVIFSAVSTAVTTANGQATAIRYGANRLTIMVDEIEYY